MFEDLAQRCDTIEECYEFMLAYAAQGLSGDAGSATGGELRQLLSRAAEALEGMAEAWQAAVSAAKLEPAEKYDAFLRVLGRDAEDALAAVELVRAQSALSSQLIDNLNASIHLRSLLTDLFLIDEVIQLQRRVGDSADAGRSAN
jgi:hypothetical protein